MDRILRVTGTGRLTVVPDTISMKINICGLSGDYGAAVEDSAVKTEKLASALVKQGFDPKLLKTESFDINAKFDYSRDNNGNSSRRFLGYEYSHALNYVMPRDNVRLSAFLNVLKNFNFGFSFSFTVKDAERVRNDLLAAAVRDASEKAKILAKAAEVELLAIAEIDYSGSFPRIETRAYMATEFTGDRLGAPVSVDINPDDVRLSESVSVVWTIA